VTQEKIKCLIADDEPHARRLIRTLLEKKSDFEIVAECGDGRSAVDAARRLHPDLLFLDVQMPGMDGFEVLASLAEGRLPSVIFVTAYDRYALKAFDVHALDYLLKPEDEDRFAQTLERAKAAIRGGAADEDRRKLEALLLDLQRSNPGFSRLLLKSAGRITFLPLEEIDWIEAAGNYMRVHAGKETHLMRETMASLESRLDPMRFVRIHRSVIVNLDRIQELVPSQKGEFDVRLRGGSLLTLSRKYRPEIEARLGGKL